MSENKRTCHPVPENVLGSPKGAGRWSKGERHLGKVVVNGQIDGSELKPLSRQTSRKSSLTAVSDSYIAIEKTQDINVSAFGFGEAQLQHHLWEQFNWNGLRISPGFKA